MGALLVVVGLMLVLTCSLISTYGSFLGRFRPLTLFSSAVDPMTEKKEAPGDGRNAKAIAYCFHDHRRCVIILLQGKDTLFRMPQKAARRGSPAPTFVFPVLTERSTCTYKASGLLNIWAPGAPPAGTRCPRWRGCIGS